MLPIRSHARRRLLSLPALPALPACFRRSYIPPVALKREILKASDPISEQLSDSLVWTPPKLRPKGSKPIARADKTRINITSESLCDDITTYLGDSLLRHQGCDLIDMYPGAGVWSRKLHDVLQPRSHILMEPDCALYTPFLQSLLDKPGTRLVPKAGIVWTDLNSVLSPEFLPHQTPRPWAPATPPERNDTLLVTMNLASFPARRFLNFESVASLVLFQLLSSMRAGSIFQRYGLVRLLVWTTPEDKSRLLPRVIQCRNRAAMDAELNTEWVREVAGVNNTLAPVAGHNFSRDMNIDIEGMAKVVARMRAQGLATPPGRESDMLADVREIGDGGVLAADNQAPVWPFSDEAEFLELSDEFQAGRIERGTNKFKRYQNLLHYHSWKQNRSGAFFTTEAERRAIIDLYRAASPDAPEREAAWIETLANQDRKRREQYQLYRDNLHVFNQDPPVLMWDRRPYEPLRVEPDEFFPNVPMALMDIQPRATHPLLRDMGRHSTHAGDFFELIMRSLMSFGTQGPSSALRYIAPGCSDAVIPNCPSLRDPDAGGSPMSGYGEISCRTLNERQMMEILQAWMDWPLKPSYSHLVGRLTDTEEPEDEE
ncbi:S-adenosyl-L-methionine-dependent methyltransferase [Podospora conica]|nr:S-adenosyl-L-methionine-dependent methyltransferase [Schizothecium conicum]